MSSSYTGGCLCGELRYEILSEPITVYNCHCTECQKVAASAFGMSVRVTAEKFNITMGQSKSFETVADSGRSKLGFFCPECGIRICGKPASGDLVVVKAGTLDNPNWFEPIAHIWTRSAQSWFIFADGLPKFEQQPKDSDELGRLWNTHTD